MSAALVATTDAAARKVAAYSVGPPAVGWASISERCLGMRGTHALSQTCPHVIHILTKLAE